MDKHGALLIYYFSIILCFLGLAYADTKSKIQDDIDDTPPPKFDIIPDMVSGMLAGLMTCFAFYPLECVEARLQVAPSKSGLESKNKQGLIAVAKQMLAQEGVAAFYKGLTPTIIGSAINWGLYFGIYEYQNNIWKQTHEPSIIGYLRSAIIAGVVCTIVVNPFWVLKIRLATSRSYSSMFHALRAILQQEGIQGLWKGVGISLVGVSEGAVQFVSYEQLRIIGGPTVMGKLFAGGTARLIAGLATYPYLLLRSALQAQNSPYHSVTDAISKIYSREGFAGFYKGMVPNLIRNVPPSACTFFLVDYLRVALFGVSA